MRNATVVLSLSIMTCAGVQCVSGQCFQVIYPSSCQGPYYYYTIPSYPHGYVAGGYHVGRPAYRPPCHHGVPQRVVPQQTVRRATPPPSSERKIPPRVATRQPSAPRNAPSQNAQPAPARKEPKPSRATPTQDLITTARAAGSFKTLLDVATVSGVLEELNGPGPFTVFAPTDDAFLALGRGVMDRLRADPESLKDVLLYHALRGKVSAKQATQRGNAKSILGPEIQFQLTNGVVRANAAQITQFDVECTNGVIHVIDRVLFPPGFRLPN